MSRRQPFVQINFEMGNRILTYWLRMQCRIFPKEAEYLSNLLNEFYRRAPKTEDGVTTILKNALATAGLPYRFEEHHSRPTYIVSKYKLTKLRGTTFRLFADGQWQENSGKLYTVKCTKKYVEPFSQYLKTTDGRLYVYEKDLVSLPVGCCLNGRPLYTGDIVLCDDLLGIIVYNEQTDGFEIKISDSLSLPDVRKASAVIGNYFEIGQKLQMFGEEGKSVKTWSAMNKVEQFCVRHYYRTELQRLNYEFRLDFPALFLYRTADEIDYYRRYQASRHHVKSLRLSAYRQYHYRLKQKWRREITEEFKERLLLSARNNPREIID